MAFTQLEIGWIHFSGLTIGLDVDKLFGKIGVITLDSGCVGVFRVACIASSILLAVFLLSNKIVVKKNPNNLFIINRTKIRV